MSEHDEGFVSRLDRSAVLTVIGIILLFSSAVGVTLVAPQIIEKQWTTPTSDYQVQMYEVADPHFYISNRGYEDRSLMMVYHLIRGYSLLAFNETRTVRIVAPAELEQYVTRLGDEQTKLTSHLMLLRKPQTTPSFDAVAAAQQLRTQLQEQAQSLGQMKLDYEILELYIPDEDEAFALAETDGVLENWVEDNYVILDQSVKQPWHRSKGVIYVSNPHQFLVTDYQFGDFKGWRYTPEGQPIASLEELKGPKYGFVSRKHLIDMGEDIYRAEGCWYCHTDQTRTLVQDLVVNGSESEPAPPSTPNEYVYNRVTFMGTQRNGPDLSRVGVKRPNRDWHKSHFWSPKLESKGSIMPSFRHFFDDDPRGTANRAGGVPNLQFEAIFQYLMTKGTRITAPTQAWWLGRDPVGTKDIIEGRRQVVQKAPLK